MNFKLILAILAFIQLQAVFIICQYESVQPIPQFFKDPATKYTLGSCKYHCVRKYLGDWSQKEWSLFSQLWLEANKRGYVGAFGTEHNYDCTAPQRGGNHGCLFHNIKNLFPWHRIFTAHFEWTLQKIDEEINPGRATWEGPFCLGYFDWGYQVEFHNKLSDYKYIFDKQRLGSIKPGPISDSKFRNIKVNNTEITRAPVPGNNNWDNAAIVACLSCKEIEGNGDASVGFRPCLEYGPHNSLHNDVGGMFPQLTAPWEPLFFLHHAMVDYAFDLWVYNLRGKTFPKDYNSPIPRPYRYMGLKLRDTWSSGQFCYSYQKPRQENPSGVYSPSKTSVADNDGGKSFWNNFHSFFNPHQPGPKGNGQRRKMLDKPPTSPKSWVQAEDRSPPSGYGTTSPPPVSVQPTPPPAYLASPPPYVTATSPSPSYVASAPPAYFPQPPPSYLAPPPQVYQQPLPSPSPSPSPYASPTPSPSASPVTSPSTTSSPTQPQAPVQQASPVLTPTAASTSIYDNFFKDNHGLVSPELANSLTPQQLKGVLKITKAQAFPQPIALENFKIMQEAPDMFEMMLQGNIKATQKAQRVHLVIDKYFNQTKLQQVACQSQPNVFADAYSSSTEDELKDYLENMSIT